MSNASIARRMLEVLDRFDRGEAGAMLVTESIELHAPALEGLTRETRDKLDRLATAVLTTSSSEREREMLGITELPTASRGLRTALERLL